MEHKQIGDNVPETHFKILSGSGLSDLTYSDVFDKKRVIIFSLPGAFTPTCSSTHLPTFERLAPVFKKHGIDDIYCISVNDPFVMASWAKDQGAKNVKMLPDGNGDFTSQMGFLVDKKDLGFGNRSWRYAMVVNNGEIEALFVEPQKPGDPFEVSDAHTVLKYIAPDAEKPRDITIITKPGCSHCDRAKQLLTDIGLGFEEVKLGSNGLSLASLSALTGRSTTPQIFVDGNLIGGADDLEEYLDS